MEMKRASERGTVDGVKVGKLAAVRGVVKWGGVGRWGRCGKAGRAYGGG